MAPRTYRRITFVALVLLAFIVVTGGAVRLTGSGLGCPHWPTCDNQIVRVGPSDIHKSIESVNRTITGLVSVAVVVAVLGSLFRRPRRRDLVWLSLGLVAGVVGQIVLGGLVVLFDLYPPLVMGHFIVSMLLVLDAVVLHHRAGRPDDPAHAGAPPKSAVPPAPVGPVVPNQIVTMGRLLVVAAAMVLFLGTIVTASGPHPGSNGDQVVERLAFSLHNVARLHGIGVMLFLTMTLATIWAMVRSGVPRRVLVRAEVLLAVLVAQAIVGYVQYFTGVPALLVGIHIAGATLVWIAVLRFHLGLSEPVAISVAVQAPGRAVVAAPAGAAG